ncbi:transcriptional regulator, partial [Rhizobium ruizarguesonis]
RSHGACAKHIKHPILGPLAFAYSAFQVDGRPDLSMVVYNPATAEDAAKIRELGG